MFRLFAAAVMVVFVSVFLGCSEGKKVSSEKEKEHVAVIETDFGKIVFKFYFSDAPKTCENFINLAKKGFYENLTFHRIVPGFVIQGGCPNGDGTGGPGYFIKAEFLCTECGGDGKEKCKECKGTGVQFADPQGSTKRPCTSCDGKGGLGPCKKCQGTGYKLSMKHRLGTVAMARAAHPDSAGCQFYICLTDLPQLDGKYTVFGQVIEGADVVQKIGRVETVPGDRPKSPVYMRKVYIEEREVPK
jgi:peptidyl-prolyl cis-trans isomerase B (cyclophilin B)